MNRWVLLTALVCVCSGGVSSQTIAEKMASGPSAEGTGDFDGTLKNVNQQLAGLRAELSHCYEKAEKLHAEDAPEETFYALLAQTNALKSRLHALENAW